MNRCYTWTVYVYLHPNDDKSVVRLCHGPELSVCLLQDYNVGNSLASIPQPVSGPSSYQVCVTLHTEFVWCAIHVYVYVCGLFLGSFLVGY